MFVCLCKGITDHQIKSAIYDGATSVGLLRKSLGVSSQCGKCSNLTHEILQETLQEPLDLNGVPQFYAVA